MNQNFRPEPHSDRDRSDSPLNNYNDNIQKAAPGIYTQSHSLKETLEPGDLQLENAPSNSRNQKLKTLFPARITATLVGAMVMLPVLAVGTATYYFGSQAIKKQAILLKRTSITDLAEAELREEKQLLAMLLIGTGSTALLAGAIAALWVKRTSRPDSAFVNTANQSLVKPNQEEEKSSEAKFLDYLSQPFEPTNILAVAVKEAQKALKCDRVVVYSLNQENYSEIIAESVSSGWTQALGLTIKDPCFEAKYIEKYRDGRIKALNNIYEANVTPCHLEQLEKLEVKANLVTPILHKEQLFGLLVAHHCATSHVWQPEEIDLLTRLSQKVGFALDNTKLLDDSQLLIKQTEAEVQWLEFLTDATRNIRQSFQQEDVLNVAVEEVQQILQCERVVVYSLDSKSQGVVVAESVSPGWTRALGSTIKDPCFETRYLEQYQDGRVRALNNIYEAEMTSCYLEQLEKLEVKANLVTPILNEGKLFGLLVAHQCSSPRAWQQQEIHWVTQIATQVGFALDNAKLLAESTQIKEQTAKEAQWTEYFTDATRHIRQSLKQEDILKVTVEEVRLVLDCQRVVVYSLNQEKYGVVIAESVAPAWTRALGITIKDPCFESKYLEKYENGRVRALDNIHEAGMTSCYIEQLEKLEVKANLVTPIINEGKLFGLLVAHQCSSPRTWQQYEIRWVTQIATQVGFALDNAKRLASSTALQQQADSGNQWTKALQECIQYLRGYHRQSDILTMSVEEARLVLNCERVVVYGLNRDSYGKVIAESVAPGWTRAIGITIKDPCFETRYLEKYQNGRVRALDNIYEAGLNLCYIEQLEKLEVKANLVTPIIVENQIFGLLVAHHCEQPHKWQPQEIDFLSQLATQGGLALERAELITQREQLEKQTETETQWTQFFTQAVQHIRQSLKHKDILNISVEEVRRALKCERVVVYSLNQEKYGEIIAESVARGWTRALGQIIKDPCFEARYLEKYRDGRVRALDNIYASGMTSCYLEQLEKLEVKANLVTPIINEGKLFGLLVAHQCSAPRQWQQYEIRWVTQIATQVGFALDNAKLLHELEQSSLTTNKISAQQKQQTEVFTQQVSEILRSGTTTSQTLSQEALQQSETVMDVLHQFQEMSDSVRGQVGNLQQVKSQEQQEPLKIQHLQETLNQAVDNITAIQDSVNDAALKIMQLSKSSPKLLEVVNLIQDLGKRLAQESMNLTIAISRTESMPQLSVAELTKTVLSPMQQLYEASAQINPLLLNIERETRDAVTALDSSQLKLTKGTDALKDVQQKLSQINLDSVNRSLLVDKIVRASENQLQVSASVRQSVQEIGNLAHQISNNSFVMVESFNRLAALTQPYQPSQG